MTVKTPQDLVSGAATRRPVVVVAEPYHPIANALQDVVALAGCVPVVVSGTQGDCELRSRPAAIVVRVDTALSRSPHVTLADVRGDTPPLIVALASNEEDAAEAKRCGCQVIARPPNQMKALYETLRRLAAAARGQA